MAINRGGCALTGDWNRLRSFLKEGQDMVDGVNEVIEEEAEKIRSAVQREIPYYAVPNAESTIARKGFNAPLVQSGVLKSQGIVVNEYTSRDKDFKKYYVVQGNENLQVKSGEKDSDLNYAELLEIMENGVTGGGKYGNVDIPPRPVLTITFDRLKKELENEIITKTFSKVHEALR